MRSHGYGNKEGRQTFAEEEDAGAKEDRQANHGETVDGKALDQEEGHHGQEDNQEGRQALAEEEDAGAEEDRQKGDGEANADKAVDQKADNDQENDRKEEDLGVPAR